MSVCLSRGRGGEVPRVIGMGNDVTGGWACGRDLHGGVERLAIKIRNAQTFPPGRRERLAPWRHTPTSPVDRAQPPIVWIVCIASPCHRASQPVVSLAFEILQFATDCFAEKCVGIGDRNRKAGIKLTFDFERMPLEPSIQTYSAMTAPFWGRSRYFLSCLLH